MKILITGVHGFVGSNLEEELSKDMIPDIDAIIHLAGKAHDTKNEAAADVYFKVNTELMNAGTGKVGFPNT